MVRSVTKNSTSCLAVVSSLDWTFYKAEFTRFFRNFTRLSKLYNCNI